MWKQKLQLLLLLMIWATLITTGDCLRPHSSIDTEAMNLDPSITTFDLQNPIIVLPAQKFDQHDRAFEVPATETAIDLVGWAGPGDPRNTSNTSPPVALPKWVPDSRPVKDKHWEAIVEALESVETQPQTTYTAIPYYQGPQLHEAYLQPTEKALSAKLSTSDLSIPELFNPLPVFLPNQLRRNDHQSISVNRHHSPQNSHTSFINTNKDDSNQIPTYITWPNSGHYKPQDIAREDIRQLVQSTVERSPIYEENFNQVTSPKLSANSMVNQNIILWRDLANVPSSPIQSVNAFTANNGQHSQTNNIFTMTQGPHIKNETNTSLFRASPLVQYQLINDGGKIFFPKDTKVSPNNITTNLPLPSTLSKIKNSLGTTFNNTLHRKNDTQNEDRNTNSNLSNKKTEAAKEVYKQPWLHAAVQHDLKEWGYPYDDDAPPNPYAKLTHDREGDDSTFITEQFGPLMQNIRMHNTGPVKKQVAIPIDSISIDVSPYFHKVSKSRPSDIYPTATGHKSAEERQGGNTFRNLMRPFRNIFQLGREPRNSPPHRVQFTRQLASLPNLPSEMQPPPIITSQFPDFGPPKGDDIVTEEQNPRQQENEVEDIQDSFTPPKQLQQETIVDDGDPNQVFEQQPESEAQTFLSPPSEPTHQHITSINQNAHHETQFEPPILQNDNLPPFPNAIQEEPLPFFTPPQTIRNAAPSTDPPFVPWPNFRTTSTNVPNNPEPPTTLQPGFSFFNQPPTLRPFRLPTLPRMRFPNPFNMFRSRETANTNTNGVFSWFPSLMSKTDTHRDEDVESKVFDWPNLKTGSASREIPSQPLTIDVNTRPLRHFRDNKNIGDDFTFKPQVSTGTHHKKHSSPSIQNTFQQPHTATSSKFKLSAALSQSPKIHQMNLSDNGATKQTHKTHSLQTTTEKYQADTIFIVSSNNEEQVVNPQTNPARKASSQKDTNNESLGPSLIKFTIDDVLDTSFHQNDQKLDQKMQPPNIKGPVNFWQTGDMEFGPSEGKATIAMFQDSTTQPSIFSKRENQSNTDFKHVPETTTPITLTTSEEPQNSRNNTTRDKNLPNNSMQLKPKFQLTLTPFPKPTTQFTSTATPVTTKSPIFSRFISSHKPFQALSENEPVHQVYSSIGTSSPSISRTATTTNAPNNNPILKGFSLGLDPSLYQSNKKPEMKNSNPNSQQSHISSINNSNSRNHFTVTTQSPDKSNFVTVDWRHSNSERNSPDQLFDTQGRTNTNDFISEASSRITIIEATPMPMEGEIYPTAKYFQTYMPITPKATTISYDQQKTTTPSYEQPKTTTTGYERPKTTTPSSEQPPKTTAPSFEWPPKTTKPRYESPTTSSPSVFQWRNNPTPSSLGTPKHVLMPGNSNHRTMANLPKVESDITIKNGDQNLSSHSQSDTNNLKIRYNAPPRKISHAHETEKPEIEMETLSTSVIPTTVFKMTENQYTTKTNPTEEKEETEINQNQSTVQAAEQQPQSSNIDLQQIKYTSNLSQTQNFEQDGALISTTTSTARPLLAGRQTRYNSLQRLKDFMSSKRNHKSQTPTEEPTALPASHLTTSSLLTSTTPTPITSSSLPHNSYRTTNHRLRSTTTSLPSQRTITPTKTPWYRQTTTNSPTTTEPSSPSPESSNFKHRNHELSGSSSKTSYEWRPPIHHVNLQDHPEMLDLYNWESVKVDEPQDRYDTSSSLHHESETDDENTNSWLPGQDPEASSHLRLPRSNPTFISKEKQTLSSSRTQVQDDTTTLDHSNRAWKRLKEHLGQKETL